MLQHRTNSEPTRRLERSFYVLVDMCSGFEIDCIFRLMSLNLWHTNPRGEDDSRIRSRGLAQPRDLTLISY